MNARQLIEALAEVEPETPVVLRTGNNQAREVADVVPSMMLVGGGGFYRPDRNEGGLDGVAPRNVVGLAPEPVLGGRS